MSQVSGHVGNRFVQKIASKEFRNYLMRYAITNVLTFLT